MIDLTAAQDAISAAFHTNTATVYRPVITNVDGMPQRGYIQVLQTTCHAVDPRIYVSFGAANGVELGEVAERYLTFPYGTDVREDDRVETLGRRYRVKQNKPAPQFALEVMVPVVDVTGEPGSAMNAAATEETVILIDI